MSTQIKNSKIAGVVLAGGRARRMANQDKGLIQFKNRALISYALEALKAVSDLTFINANRNLVAYEAFGLPVITDQTHSFDGPLAGILTTLIHTDTEVLLVMPCDTPYFKAEHLQQLLTARTEHDADIAIAFDGVQLHPLFLALKASLTQNLQDFLASGQRKVGDWLKPLNSVYVDFSHEPTIFININSSDELAALEAQDT
ncbi:MAG: molybdenum cofactor guanylyltransferase [Methylococcales bacterium]|nr:MAG: molybdenum cofactor guanylyltransferase [Methylococcales bacterium]